MKYVPGVKNLLSLGFNHVALCIGLKCVPFQVEEGGKGLFQG
jgi:hypothetical protein